MGIYENAGNWYQVLGIRREIRDETQINKSNRSGMNKELKKMNVFTRSINQVFKRAYSSFQAFPASILAALGFAVVTMVRIQLDWPEQEAYNFLFNCLHWSFALGAIFGLAVLTAAKRRFDEKRIFSLANVLTLIVVALTLLIVYTQGGGDAVETLRYRSLTPLTISRLMVAIDISLLSFILLARANADFARSLFMTWKAFFIAVIYGSAMMAGASIVAGALENLVYQDMSEKVYMYIATIVGFLAFTVFVGYFPDFRKGTQDSRRVTAEKQPQFVEVLLGYILIPILFALTFVLFLWAARTLITGEWPDFIQLSSIASTYAIGGVLLHLLVTHHESSLALFYKRFYPIAALVILVFQAWALGVQLGKFGLKTTEYSFALLWIVAVASMILLLRLKERAHFVIVVLICIVSFVSVMPWIGYYALPVTAQVHRLENLLVKEGILKDKELIPAENEPEKKVREAITDAVFFLAYAENAKLPEWFDKQLAEGDVFKEELGFELTWPDDERSAESNVYRGLNLILPEEVIAINAYEWMFIINESYREDQSIKTLDSSRGTYQFYWMLDSPDRVPRFKMVLNDRVVLEGNLNNHLDKLMERYPLTGKHEVHATLDDMSVIFESSEIAVMIVFHDISINVDPQNDDIFYWMNPLGVYVHEK